MAMIGLMKRGALSFAVVVLAAAMATAAERSAPAVAIQEALAATGELRVGSVRLDGARLREFYEGRDFAPAWSDEGGPVAAARALLETLQQADQHALVPRDYSPLVIASRLAASTPEERAELDLLLSNAFLRYVTDVRDGRVEPQRIDPELFVAPRRTEALAMLVTAVDRGTVTAALGAAAPPQEDYARLVTALDRYRAHARQGGWPLLPDGPVLKPGAADARLAVLCRRLQATADADEECGDAERYTDTLVAAVERFQRRHGLEPDGVVGPATRAALNRPPQHWIDLIELNIERWRWLPDDLGRRHVFVNLAGFDLKVMEAGASILEMPVVVGRAYWHTPVFSSEITDVVINPFWHVPRSIAADSLLRRIREDPSYLSAAGFRVFTRDGGRAVDPRAVDWSAVAKGSLPYSFRQDPGPKNALGRLKFELPNPFAIYLHDTPDRQLFERTVRTFSSGCIRLAQPAALALYLLGGEWSAPRLEAAVAAGRTVKVPVPEPVPVHIQYMTAWVAANGTVHFRDDVYGRDARLAAALARAS